MAEFLKLSSLYGINAVSHGNKTVTIFPDYKTKFASLYTRLTTKEGWTDAKFQKLNVFPAAFMDLMWKRCALGSDAVQLVSVINIELPIGKWDSNLDCVLPYGMVEGHGTFINYPGNDSTQISMNNAGWLGSLKDDNGKVLRTLFVSPTYGQESFVSSYHESCGFRNVRLTGNCADTFDPSYLSYGLYIWDCGETGDVEKVYAHNFNTAGFAFERGTPVHADNLTAFNCHYTGIHLRGTAMATMRFSASVDDCPDMFRMDPSWGREAGGVVSFTICKKETGVTPEVATRFWNGTIVGYCQGQFAVNVSGVSNAAGSVTVPCMFFVNAKLKNGTPQRSSIFVAASKSFNCQAFVHDAGNDGVWMMPAQFAGMCLYYTTHNGGKAIVDMNEVLPKVATTVNERLGFFRGTGTFNFTTGTPAWTYHGTTAPVPPPVVDPPPPPPPVDPTPSTASQTVNNANSSTRVTSTVALVKSIEFTGLKISSPNVGSAFGGWLNDRVYCGFGGLYYGNNVFVKVVQQGVAMDVTVTFPSPVSLRYVVGADTGQQAAQWTASKVVVRG